MDDMNDKKQTNKTLDIENKLSNKAKKVIIISLMCITLFIDLLTVYAFIYKREKSLNNINKEQHENNNKQEDSENDKNDEDSSQNEDKIDIEEDDDKVDVEDVLIFPIVKENYKISGNSLEEFDMYFLKLDNTKKNKMYSPLSIKNALGMIGEGATGETKEQITSIIGNYTTKKYTNNKNMSFANTLFVRDTYKEFVKESYSNILHQKYNSQVNYDSFTSPSNINNWVKDNTLGLINNMFDDVSGNNLMLINALAIDMEWKEKFIDAPCRNKFVSYSHMNFSWSGGGDIVSYEFNNKKDEISALDITASFNNYDIVNTLGEQNIRNTVKKEFLKYLEEHPDESISLYVFDENTNGLSDDELMEKYLDRYIKEIDSNYQDVTKITDYRFFVDDSVKAIAKELKEYNGITLEYVAIMPKNEKLTNYINKVKVSEINNIISNLKELKLENFKDGVVTKIEGYIPKFKFDYDLNLKDSLNKIGITNIFDESKANLTNISNDSSLYINEIKHKTTIEFTQDGIKASAASGGLGGAAAGGFDYIYDVPVEIIDLTFDKPYMFIIRDKNTGEVWFNGTVYEPLKFSEDKSGCLPYREGWY